MVWVVREGVRRADEAVGRGDEGLAKERGAREQAVENVGGEGAVAAAVEGEEIGG